MGELGAWGAWQAASRVSAYLLPLSARGAEVEPGAQRKFVSERGRELPAHPLPQEDKENGNADNAEAAAAEGQQEEAGEGAGVDE